MTYSIHTAFIRTPERGYHFANLDAKVVIKEIAEWCRHHWRNCPESLSPLDEDDEKATNHFFQSAGEGFYLLQQQHTIDIPFAMPETSVLGPDGIALHPETYKTLEELVTGVALFMTRFMHQGYFKDTRGERISLTDLATKLNPVVYDEEDDDEPEDTYEWSNDAAEVETEDRLLAGPLGTEEKVRAEFWERFPEFRDREYRAGKEHNDYSDECRQTFHEWKDALHKGGLMADSVCDNSTL